MAATSKIYFAVEKASTLLRKYKETWPMTISTPCVTYIDAALCNVTYQAADVINLSFSSQCPSNCELVIIQKLQNETGWLGRKFLSSNNT
jgi:hypothetical protein